MTKVTINNQFHYITVKVVFPPKQTCNMTWSHGGMKLSGSADWGPHAIMRAMECPKGTTVGAWSKLVATASAKAASVAELAAQINAASL